MTTTTNSSTNSCSSPGQSVFVAGEHPARTPGRASRTVRYLRIALLNFLVAAFVQIHSGTPAAAQDCVGDCNDDGGVTVDELTLGVRIVLGLTPVDDASH